MSFKLQNKGDTVPKISKAIGQYIMREGRLTTNIVEEISDQTVVDFAQEIIQKCDIMLFKIAAIAAK